ncbi:hypothetical protein CMK11_07260 [Candidatus Poribacteria bacterium]|nr:hypothetical protein [Candidatus Poribacteria bacterium]
MRRAILFTGLALVCCSAFTCLHAADTIEALMTQREPTIDGSVGEAEWIAAVKTEVTPQTGSWDFGETEVSYVFHVMYDETYLYVAASLVDDDIQTDSAAEGVGGDTWKDDSVEIFIDGNHNHAADAFVAAENESGGQYVITAGNAINYANSLVQDFGPDAGSDYYTVAEIKDDTHWEMEARLRMRLFDSAQEGDVVGFNISTNDDDGGGDEEAALFWTGAPPDIYSNEAAWGDLIFGEAYAVEPAGKLAVVWAGLRSAP